MRLEKTLKSSDFLLEIYVDENGKCSYYLKNKDDGNSILEGGDFDDCDTLIEELSNISTALRSIFG
jgi:hypothetical protein